MALTTIDDRGLNYPVDLLDNEQIRFGTGNDFAIYHDGSHSYLIDGGTGDLIINSNSTVRINPNAGGEYGFAVHSNGACEAFYDNSKKFETTSLGIDVTGSIRGDDITIEKPSGHLSAYFTATDGLGTLEIGGSDGAFIDLKTPVSDDFDLRINADGTLTSGGNINFTVQGNETGARFLANGACELYHDNSKKLETSAAGVTTWGRADIAVGASTSAEIRLTANSTGSGAGDRGRFNVYSARNDGTAFNAGYIDIDRSSGTADEAHMTFNVNGGSGVGEKARITKYGTLLVAITSQEEPGNGNTTEGTSLKWDGRYFHSMPGTWGCINRNDSDGTLMVFAREGTHVGHISVGSSSTAYNTTSDYRLKENEVIITDGITRLKQLKPYQFNWKTDSTNTKLDGFFAHEVSSIVPEAITGTKDGVYDEDDDEANIKKGDPLYQGIDQSKLVPLLTAALQEAITEIETLKTKVAALEAA